MCSHSSPQRQHVPPSILKSNPTTSLVVIAWDLKDKVHTFSFVHWLYHWSLSNIPSPHQTAFCLSCGDAVHLWDPSCCLSVAPLPASSDTETRTTQHTESAGAPSIHTTVKIPLTQYQMRKTAFLVTATLGCFPLHPEKWNYTQCFT